MVALTDAAETRSPAAWSIIARGPVLAGLYAWLNTVLMPVWSARAELVVQCTAWTAGVSLLIGAFLSAAGRAWWGRYGSGLFIGLSLVSWVLVARQPGALLIDPVQAALGGFGWSLFAASLSPVSTNLHPDRVTPLSSTIKRSGRERRVYDLFFSLLILASTIPVALAWRVPREPHAVLAHVIACGAALLSFVLAGGIADVTRRSLVGPRRRISMAWPPLAALAVLLAVGALLRVL